MRRLDEDPKIKLKILLCDFHFKEIHNTSRELIQDGFQFETIKGETFGELADNFLSRFEKRKDINIVLVVGDRRVALASAYAAYLSKTYFAHIHGGDKTTSGHIDEPVRHAVTRFAHIHFPASIKSAERLRKMGEEKFRIHQVGSPVIDAFKDALKKNKISKKELYKKFNLDPKKPFFILLQHPTLLQQERAGKEMAKTLSALAKLKVQTIAIHPNGDPGTEAMLRELDKHDDANWLQIHKSIHHEDFCQLLRYAAALVGNSSAGIIECSYVKCPAVNIGERNRERERGANVVFAENNTADIIRAITRARSPQFKRKMRKSRSPYGHGKSAEKIVNRLKSISLDVKLLCKQMTL
jgi:UDP-hydrolysing UDP-N-acetyl-D-glucosamine 2-epimerase